MKTHAMSLMRLRMPRVAPLAATLTLMLLAGMSPGAAYAQTCHNVLQGHANWANTKPDGDGNYSLQFAMVSNQLLLNGTFAEGSLTHKLVFSGEVFSGSGLQYFSKKRWGPSSAYPFDPNQADSIKVLLNATLSRATLSLANATYTFDLLCDHPGVLRGVGNPQGPFNITTPMFVISLKRHIEAIVN